MTKHHHIADGSITGHRLESAVVRALDAHMTLIRRADRLSEELDQTTIPGVIHAQLTDEDSLIIAIHGITRHPTT